MSLERLGVAMLSTVMLGDTMWSAVLSVVMECHNAGYNYAGCHCQATAIINI
jgi:hypothetical protein